MRRLLNHAFSDQALRGQEGFINSYINLLIEKLHKKAASDSQVDLMRWLNFTTFDIIGDLCFGESFDSLKNEDYNFWVANIFKGLKIARMLGLQSVSDYRITPFEPFEIVPATSKSKTEA
jgi:cytochrome P450